MTQTLRILSRVVGSCVGFFAGWLILFCLFRLLWNSVIGGWESEHGADIMVAAVLGFLAGPPVGAAAGATIVQRAWRRRSSFWQALLGAVAGASAGGLLSVVILQVSNSFGIDLWQDQWTEILLAPVAPSAGIIAGAIIGSGWIARQRISTPGSPKSGPESQNRMVGGVEYREHGQGEEAAERKTRRIVLGAALLLVATVVSAFVVSGVRSWYNYQRDSRPTGPVPVISDISVQESPGGWIEVQWTTDVPSTSWVRYDTDEGDDYYDYRLDGVSDQFAYVTSHQAQLGGALEPGTTYHYRVFSWSSGHQRAMSVDYAFTYPGVAGP